MTSASLDWVWQAVGAVMALGGFALAMWALFRDRARGRERCPQCWYDMKGWRERGSLGCPECGRDARSATQLEKTRRRWRWAGLALVVMALAWPASVWTKAARDGWARAAPTWALAVLEPDAPLVWLSEPGFFRIEQTGMMKELLRRVDAGEGGDAWAWCVRRAYAGRGRWVDVETDASLERLAGDLGVGERLSGTAGWAVGELATRCGLVGRVRSGGEDRVDVELGSDDCAADGLDAVCSALGGRQWVLEGGEVLIADEGASDGRTLVCAYEIGDVLDHGARSAHAVAAWSGFMAAEDIVDGLDVLNALELVLHEGYENVFNGGSGSALVWSADGRLWLRGPAAHHVHVRRALASLRAAMAERSR